jgi:hypothetical protein
VSDLLNFDVIVVGVAFLGFIAVVIYDVFFSKNYSTVESTGIEVIFHTGEGKTIAINSFDKQSLMDLLDAYSSKKPVLQVNLDDGIVYFNTDNIVRIDVNQ